MATKQTKTPANTVPQQTQPKPSEPTIDWSQYGTTGYEKTSTEDLGVPFLVVVQKGSAEVDRSHKDYATKKIEGCEAGCIINTVTRKIMHSPDGEPVIVVPCSYEKQFVEWKPREQSGGFVRQHENPAILNNCTRNEKNQDVLPNGNLIVTTGYFMCLVEAEDGWEKAIVGMTSTQLKKARGWLNMMMALKQGGRPLPMFSHKYALTSVVEQNQSGSWFGWHIEGAGMNGNQQLISEAADIAKKVATAIRPQLAAASDNDVPM